MVVTGRQALSTSNVPGGHQSSPATPKVERTCHNVLNLRLLFRAGGECEKRPGQTLNYSLSAGFQVCDEFTLDLNFVLNW